MHVITSKTLLNIKEINPKECSFSRIKLSEQCFDYNTILQTLNQQKTIKFNFAFNKFAAKYTFDNTYVKIVQKDTGNELFLYCKSLSFMLFYKEVFSKAKFSQIDKNSDVHFLHFADVSRAEFNEIQLISDPIKIKQVSCTFPYTVHDPGRFHEVIVPFINLKVFEFNECNNFLNPHDNIDGFDILSKCRDFKCRLNASLDVKLCKKLISLLPSHCEYDLIFMKSTANSFRKLW